MNDLGLEFDRISKSFGDVTACDRLTFDVRPGEIFGFVGSNGAGKTTAMRIALGVTRADSGEVRWHGDGIDLESRRRFGYMPEERGLYPQMKVGPQLEYLSRLHGLDAATAARNADHWLERLGVESRRADEVQKLSLGNQQRVQLAAALVHEPEVLVLDEPFSGLDPIAVDVMSEVLQERARAGVAVVFSSHQLDLVERLCNRVGIVRDGAIVACDEVGALKAHGRSSLVVHAPNAPADWAGDIKGVTVHSHVDGVTVLQVTGTVDDQLVLRTALATGPVHEFSHRKPTLVELFRDVVADERTNAPTTETARIEAQG